MSAAETLLSRLDGVRPTGTDRWISKCPAHADRAPSLSIRQVEDRVLLKCFAGCGAADIVAALGLSLGDLFDRPASDHRVKSIRSRIPASDLLKLLDHEAFRVWFVACHIVEHGTLGDEGFSILTQAVARIAEVRRHVY